LVIATIVFIFAAEMANHTTALAFAPSSRRVSVTQVNTQLLRARRLAAANRYAAASRVRSHLVLKVARSLRGRPYVYGATGPRAFDCSGYTSYVIRRALHRRIPRTSTAQYAGLRHLSHRRTRIGDIVHMPGHVGIYAGRNYIWHAPHPGAVVRRERLWTNYWHGLRVI
jgi:cell wall-associated NlpC family hydrolase